MESRTRSAVIMATLIVAGETVFLLPFVVARIFRPTFLDVFGITNLQLGTAFALYGSIAMAAYFLGGPLADRFSARMLMTVALLSTSLGGLCFAVIPSLMVLTLLYGFLVLPPYLMFWSSIILATRALGGIDRQGRGNHARLPPPARPQGYRCRGGGHARPLARPHHARRRLGRQRHLR